ncbi:uncharacterized protein knl1 [Tachysurus vachellii]|uniref:uncharacterized protein knl1 n=1 Tax=Tachysurus vachellii TaxID=175792 RepID=UPI00296B2BAF|nr:uncharacterized protein knl1 [Tachysurus vachellii]
MEQKDTQNVGHDQEGLSKRRISSILKAPRTSMKVFGNEQDENQEETRPIEKRRNSRRVSFATTNNIRVFPKDLKADPVIAPTQNMTVGTNEGQNERTSCFDSSVNYEVIGLDTMLTQPVQFELNKGNIFPEPHLPFDSVDKTVLLGENMDMTYSHTVVFDKEDEFNPESILSMSNANDPHKLSSQNDTTSKSFGVVEKDVMLTQFEDFLASLPMNQNAATSIPNKNKDNFTLENVSNMKMDEENVLPTGLNKLAFSERDDMDMSMTNVIMEEREALLHFPYSGDGNYDADDMEMTLCQTVLEPKSCDDYKPSDKPKKRVSLGSTSFRTKDMSPEHTGHMELNRYSFSKRTKTEDCVVPTAQMFLQRDVSNCMEAQQDTASDMTVIHDDMELTELKTITIDTKSWLTSPSNKAQSSPYVISSKTSTDKIKWSESNLAPVLASQTVGSRPPISVMESDGGNLETEDQRDQTTDTRSHHKTPKGSNSVNEHVSFNSTVKTEEFSEEDSNMVMTTVFTAPLVEQCCAAFNEEETAGKSAVTLPVTTDQKICTEIESDLDTLKKEPLSSVKSRQNCLADLKMKLQNISQYIIEPDGLLAGSVPAPLASFTEASPLEMDNSLQLSKEAQLLGNQMNLAHKEGTTPFNLRKSLMARLSVGGIMPKFPSRAGSARLNQVEPKSPNEAQDLQPQTCFNAYVQSNSYETDLIDEVLPEDDFSGTLVSDLSKSKVQEFTTEVHENKDHIEYDHMESMSQSEEIPPEVKDANTNDSSDKLWDSNCAAPNAPTHVVKTDDTNFSSNSTMIKFEGNSELTLRNSQLDSQIGGSMDHEFDFYKKLKDGSVTVNEFLTYFGANTVIHRSRPSALPDNFRATQTCTTEDLLREKYIHRPKQKVYETDCQKLSEMAEGFKTQLADQDKPLRSINETLLQDICAFSKEQLQRFGSKLKEQKMYYRKENKARSHKMKEHLYSELLKTTQEAKQSLTSKLKETNEMINDLDGCINDLEAELSGLKHIGNGDQHSLIRLNPALKAKQEQFEALNSEVTEKEKQIRELELQSQSLEDTRKKVQDETRDLDQLTNLNSLNEWRVISADKNGLVFSFLHNTLHLEVKHRKATGDEFIQNDPEQEVDISFKFLLDTDTSQSSAIMVHKLLKGNLSNQSKWQQKHLTMQKIPMLLHNVSLVVSRLRLLGEEIYRLDKWGGVRLGIFHITCVDTLVQVTFSSVEAFAKFELSLDVNPDYPFSPLKLQKFQNFIGDTRLEQITDIVSSVRPAKNYLTSVMKKIHSDLLG